MKHLPAIVFGLVLLLAPQAGRALSCSAGATPMTFGTYDPTSATPTDSTATISIACSNTVSLFVTYSIALSTGSSGSFTARKLLSGSWGLNYQIYGNAARTTVWGDGGGTTTLASGGYLLAALVSTVQNMTAYGRIAAQQNIAPGVYNDTILVTVTF